MTEGPVHYEVFIRAKASSPWVLELATEVRPLALRAAEDALNERRAVGVKVSKESRQASGRYQSLVILSKGDLEPPKGSTAAIDRAATPLCVSPSDLYTVHARERINRLLDAWLRRQNATAFELLHSPDLVERLDAAGIELQHALQKVAVPEAQATGASTHEIIRRYQKLIDAAITRLLGDGRRGLFPTLDGAGGVPACLRAAAASGEPAYVLGAAVAGALAKQTGWTAKIGRLLDLAESDVEGTGRTLLFHVLEQPLGEILGGRAGLKEFLGGEGDLGANLAALVRLMAPDAVQTLIQSDPALERALPPMSPQAGRLAGWLAAPGFRSVRSALARRLLGELQGVRRLHPDDPAAEILTLRVLARVLILSPQTVSPEDVQAVFVERSHRLVGADFVESYVAQSGGGVFGEAHALIRLAENVVGAANKRAVGAWLKATLTSLRLERELRSAAGTAVGKLAQLAELQRALPRTGLGSEDQAELSAKLGDLADEVEAKAHLVSAISHAPQSIGHRLTLLQRLASGEAAPLGPVSQRARTEALKLARDPALRTDLLQAPPDELERMRLLLQTIGLAA